MKTLIVYASNSGSTYLAGQAIKESLEFAGHTVVLQHASKTDPAILVDFDVLVLGSPSWLVNKLEGQPHEFMQEFISKLSADMLSGKLLAFYGCGDRAYLKFCGAVDEMELLVAKKGGNPSHPSLKVDSFFFDLDNNIVLIRKWAEDLSAALVKTPTITSLAF